eukprot:GEMP01068064.1.p1 GENE.GEMP01068064.1~~GEMP01068064.1.p1  ORF type:complete len:325 (+),score=93.48 GEMP01068064.1:177-1151(+)
MQCWEHAWWPRGAASWYNEAELGALEAEHQSLIERNHAVWQEAMCLLEIQGDFYQMNETTEHQKIRQFDEQRQFLHTPQREFLIQQAAQLLAKLPAEHRDAADAGLADFVLHERTIVTPLTTCSTPSTPHKHKEVLWPRPWQPPFSRQKVEFEEASPLVVRVLELEHRFLTTKLLPHLERALHVEDDRHAKHSSRFTVPITQALKRYIEKLERTVKLGPEPKAPLRLRSLCSSFRADLESSSFPKDGQVIFDADQLEPASPLAALPRGKTWPNEQPGCKDTKGASVDGIPRSPLKKDTHDRANLFFADPFGGAKQPRATPRHLS